MNKRNIKRLYILICVALGLLLLAPACFATGATGVPALDQPINNFLTFFFGIIFVVGILTAAVGVIMFVISLLQHDPTQRINSILIFVAGLVACFVRPILQFFGITV